MLILLPRLRKPTLILGIIFHLGTGLLLQIGAFPLYMICLYLPLAPWERWLPCESEKASLAESAKQDQPAWRLQSAAPNSEACTPSTTTSSCLARSPRFLPAADGLEK